MSVRQCENSTGCLTNLECEKDDATKPKRSKWLHKFDSLSYVMFKMDVGGDPRLMLPLSRQATETVRILRVG